MDFKKVTALVALSGVLASMLTGTAFSKATPKASTTSYKTHLTINLCHWRAGEAITGQSDAVLSTLEKKFNVTINPINVTWGDYKTKINTWAAAGSLPEVFSDDAATEKQFPQWISSKLVKALPSDMSAYPNIKKYLNQEDIQAYKYPFGAKNAKYYGVPRATYQSVDWWANDYCIMIRKDWMKKVGITKVPTNMDEFTKLMKAFVAKDPDGDGKADTVGLTAYTQDWLYPLFTGYEPSIMTWTKDSSNKWTAGFMTNGALKGIAAIKKLYDAGGLDRDIATFKGDEGKDKFTSGHAGAYAQSGYPTALMTLYSAFQKTYGAKWKWTDHIVLMKPFKCSDGNYYRHIQSTAWSETYFSSKCSDEKMKRVLAMLDWGFTTTSDGFKLMRYGIKGKDYTEKNGKITLINKKDSNGAIMTINQKYPSTILANWWGWFQDWSYTDSTFAYPDMQKQAKDLLDWEMKNCKPEKTNLMLSWMPYQGKENENYAMGAEIIKACASSDAVAEWKQMVNNYKANGYTKLLASMNAYAKKYHFTGYTK